MRPVLDFGHLRPDRFSRCRLAYFVLSRLLRSCRSCAFPQVLGIGRLLQTVGTAWCQSPSSPSLALRCTLNHPQGAFGPARPPHCLVMKREGQHEPPGELAGVQGLMSKQSLVSLQVAVCLREVNFRGEGHRRSTAEQQVARGKVSVHGRCRYLPGWCLAADLVRTEL